MSEEQTQEQTQEQPQTIPQTEEEIALQAALHSNQLEAFQNDPLCSEHLNILITVYFALKPLGEDAPAFQAAEQNIIEYKSPKTKAPKTPPKEKVFNEVRELRKALSAEIITNEHGEVVSDMYTALSSLEADNRISAELKSAIITYDTIRANPNLPQSVLDYAFNALASFGGKRQSTGDRKPMEFQPPYEIEFGGSFYDSLSEALRAAGFNKDTIENDKPVMWNRAWTKAMTQIRKSGTATITNPEAVETADEELVFVRHFLDEEEPIPATTE
jgi:hypothetical protein